WRVSWKSDEAVAAELRVQVTLFYCREDNTGTCRIKTLVWRVPVEVVNNPGASTEVKLSGKLTADKCRAPPCRAPRLQRSFLLRARIRARGTACRAPR